MSEEVVDEVKTENTVDEDSKDVPKTVLQLRSIVDILADLKKPIHKSKLKTRPQGGQNITYISWPDAVRYLEGFATGWEYRIVDSKVIVLPQQKIEYTITIELTINALEGKFVRAASATSAQDWDSSWIEKKNGKETGVKGRWKPVYGGCMEIAESAALRRACAKFHFGLGLYDGD
jgi:hypothetical protein